MKRRQFLKVIPAGILSSTSLIPWMTSRAEDTPVSATPEPQDELLGPELDQHIKDGLDKIKDFDRTYHDDVILTPRQLGLLQSTVARLTRLQRFVGYANFNLLGFDEALKYAKLYPAIGQFTPEELSFTESVFFEDASHYGFWGTKVITELTKQIPTRETIKLARTGHYLFRGEPLHMYEKIKRDVGDDVILTSGIRGVVKQIHLFLSKAVKTNGNLSQASRSLAPPGHSYHGIGDFDVGKKGFGGQNFTAAFSETDEYKRLRDLGYVMIRYPENNPFGVRFEPWHIKVI